MEYLKWAGIAIVALFLWSWLRKGATANAMFGAQVSPSGWGSGMIYAPGTAGGAYPYGYPPPGAYTSYAFGGQTPVRAAGTGAPPWYAYLLNAPIDVSYQNGGFAAGYGN